MKLNRQILKHFPPVAIVLLIILSAATLVINNGFLYSFHHPKYIVEIEATNVGSVIDQYNFYRGVSQVNRFKGQLILQEVTADYVEGLVTELENREDVKSVSVTQSQNIISLGISTRISYGLLGAALVAFAFLHFFVLRQLSKIQGVRASYLTFLLLLLGLYAGVFIFVGILSMVSTIYELTPVAFAAIGIAGVWGIVLTYLSLKSLLTPPVLQKLSVTEMLSRTRGTIKSSVPTTVVVWGTILSGLVVGLGVKFLLESILIAVAISITIVSMYHLPLFVHGLLINGSKFRLPARAKKSDKPKTRSKAESEKVVDTKPAATKSKVANPKARTKSKSKPRNRR